MKGYPAVHPHGIPVPTRPLRLLPLAAAPLLLAGAAHAATGSHGGPDYVDFGWRVFNFAILIGLGYWLLAHKIKTFFSDRRRGIKSALAEAAASRAAAQNTFQEYEAKLTRATGEIEAIGAMIKAQGQAERERLIAEGRRAAEKMRDDAQARMEQAFGKASQELRAEAVRLSTEMAEELLKRNVGPADHEALVRDYIEKVVNKP